MSHKQQFNIKYITRAQRWHRNYLAALGSFLVAFIASCTLAPVHNSDASELINVTNAATGYYVNVSNTSSSGINLEVNSVPTGTVASATDSLTTQTNSPTGYKLYLSASPNYLYLDGDSSSSNYFSPLGAPFATPTRLSKDTWGFALNTASSGVVDNAFSESASYTSNSADAKYATVPTTEQLIQSTNSANEAGVALDVYYGINASTDLPSGTYTGTITYTATAEGITTDYDTMQNFTAQMCSELEESTASADNRITLQDSRDQKPYRVAKLADGHCWMVQNLALDGNITLHPSDSNVTTDVAIPSNYPDGTTSSYTDMQIFSQLSGYDGNYYNWCAAIASSADCSATDTVINTSICPRGWKLPDYTGDFSYSNLLGSYGLPVEDIHAEGDNPYTTALEAAPLYFTRPGRYDYYTGGGGYLDQGSDAGYWESYASSAETTGSDFRFNYYNGWHDYFPKATDVTRAAFSVRCVFGEN